MIAAGVNAKALSEYMGHANIGITLDRYGHLMPGNEAEAAGLLDALPDAGHEDGTLSALSRPVSRAPRIARRGGESVGCTTSRTGPELAADCPYPRGFVPLSTALNRPNQGSIVTPLSRGRG